MHFSETCFKWIHLWQVEPYRKHRKNSIQRITCLLTLLQWIQHCYHLCLSLHLAIKIIPPITFQSIFWKLVGVSLFSGYRKTYQISGEVARLNRAHPTKPPAELAGGVCFSSLEESAFVQSNAVRRRFGTRKQGTKNKHPKSIVER